MKLDKRTRILATVMALAILIHLPLPDFQTPVPHRLLVVFLLWTANLALAICTFRFPDSINLSWGFYMLVAVFEILVLKNPMALILLVIWKLWLSARLKRLGMAKILSVKTALFLCCLAGTGYAAEVPDNMKGKKIEELASCGVIDQIPWVFRKGKRQSRFLLRDKLRLSTQSDFSIWEVHQVLDSGTYIAYVFKRIRDDGIMEAIVTKEQHYNRILEKGKQRRIAEVRSLKTLIDRPVLSFYSADGGSVIFLPSLGGQARLQINFSGERNRVVPPILLTGRSCERMVDPDTNAAIEKSAAGAGAAAPAAGAAAGSSP